MRVRRWRYARPRLLLLAALAATLALLPASVARASDDVQGITWANFNDTPSDADSLAVRTALRNTDKYALTTWWNTDADWDAQDRETYLDFGGRTEHYVRPVSSAAFGLAVSIATGAYDATHTGVSLSTAKARTVKMIRSLAYRHRATAGASTGWGNAWQSALWAEQAGAAGWLLWDELTSTDRSMVRAMVWYEATRFIGYQAPYWKDVLGNTIYSGDSKAEESAWNAGLMHLALAMFPTHSRWEAWSFKAAELAIGAWAAPQDLTSSVEYGGREIPTWLYGYNLESDGNLWNHGIIHPDYMVTKTLMLHAPAYLTLAGLPSPTYLHHNGDLVYDALVDVVWPNNGRYQAPGGTMYIPSSADVYYPYRGDWGNARRMIFANFDVQARAYGWDSSASPTADVWEDLHVGGLLDQQARHSDGHTFANDTEDNYPGKELVVSEEIAGAWLTKWLMVQRDASGAQLRQSDYAIPVVLDNRDREFSVVSGTWTLYSQSSVEPDVMGDDARYNAAGTGSDVVRFRPYLSENRTYEIFAWWNAYRNQATNAPFTITHSGGTTTVRVDQTTNSGRWVSLGRYTCPAGNTCRVDLSDNANGYVIADAVKFQ